MRKSTLEGVITTFQQLIATGNIDKTPLALSDAYTKEITFWVLSGVVVVALLYGVAASHMTLRPLRQSLLMQKRFVAAIAHELRTPLAVIKTQNEVALLENEDRQFTKDVLRENIGEVDRMSAILDNLLLFNRVDGFEGIAFRHVNIPQVLLLVEKNLTDLAQQKQIGLVHEVGDVPAVYGNVAAIEQLFYHLIKNGITYSNAGGVVKIVSESVTTHDITIRIEDEGVGISRKELPHIFEPFMRTEKGKEISKGVGMGLSVVFEIVKLHNGRIAVESKLGEGTSVFVTLPRRLAITPKSDTNNRHLHRTSYDFSTQVL